MSPQQAKAVKAAIEKPVSSRKKILTKQTRLIHKSPLKWAGGKRLLVARIAKLIGKKKQNMLIEPFVGGGSVFLNMDFSRYLLVDTNRDLINFFTHIQQDLPAFINEAQIFFAPQFNQEDEYYKARKAFNSSQNSLQRAALFLYLNRHGYNGLCRYNSKGEYNVPFGRYKKPYFPIPELELVNQRAKYADFVCADFSSAFDTAKQGDIIYCDPPYTPIGKTANFTAYSGTSFTYTDQLRLIQMAMDARDKGVTTIISNHCLPETLKMYHQANKIVRFDVARTISCKGQIRKPCKELMAIYQA